MAVEAAVGAAESVTAAVEAADAAPEQAREYAEQQSASSVEVAQRNALRACREQTGMTTAQCRADAAAGNAS
ncbi:hypothetical protein SAMN05216207_1011127 [Pseudonocardia ammonioxydans]|uniref:Uncharacterized protein n=1 Tax=Pseudonocardia ammonioxydans TaxID=260086 RepID=A0A1I4XN51_PSUAM|nr:hypothetical protein [Pseudonocardia ammonioxydans]SFN26750.1 hypothetical protein SAMN05216207_1011127 [Pseudonocardia ammonioxydans]